MEPASPALKCPANHALEVDARPDNICDACDSGNRGTAFRCPEGPSARAATSHGVANPFPASRLFCNQRAPLIAPPAAGCDYDICRQCADAQAAAPAHSSGSVRLPAAAPADAAAAAAANAAPSREGKRVRQAKYVCDNSYQPH